MVFHVSAYTDWSDHTGRTVRDLATRDDADAVVADFFPPDTFPLVDLVDDSAGIVVAARRVVPFPAARISDDFPFVPRDDFAPTGGAS